MPAPRQSTAKMRSLDPIWAEIRAEADTAVAAEPALGGFIFATVLSHDRLEEIGRASCRERVCLAV